MLHDPSPAYVRGSSSLVGFWIRCRVKWTFPGWYLFLEINFTGRGRLLCRAWFQLYLLIHLETIYRAASLRKIKFWNVPSTCNFCWIPKDHWVLSILPNLAVWLKTHLTDFSLPNLKCVAIFPGEQKQNVTQLFQNLYIYLVFTVGINPRVTPEPKWELRRFSRAGVI